MKHFSPKAETILDKVLAGQPSDKRAQVRQLVIDLDINPDEEFFAIVLGLGLIQGLLQDAPQQLKEWQTETLQQLKSWSSNHHHVLEKLAMKAEQADILTETASQLSQTLAASTQVANALTRQLQASHLAWGESWEKQESTNSRILDAIAKVGQTLDSLSRHLRSLPTTTTDGVAILGLRPAWPQSFVWGIVFYSVVSTSGLLAIGGLYLRDRNVFNEMGTKITYLLEKQNRRDCQDGVLPADSLLCSID